MESTAAAFADDYAALKRSCGLVDRSERGKLVLTGAQAVEFLNGQVTNELADLRRGEGRYAAFLTHKGKMLGDLRILALDPQDEPGARSREAEAPEPGRDRTAQPLELFLDTERVALQSLFDMIRRFKVGYRVELHKRTLERGLLSLIGPDAQSMAGAQQLPDAEHAHAPLQIAGVPALAVRTQEGVDLICDAQATQLLREALLARGARAVTPLAAECLRVESGRPRYGVDIDETTIPEEAGLNERAVSFSKGCYVGQETVARLHWRGKPNRQLRGLRLSAPVAGGEQLLLAGRPVGRVGSAVSSPSLGPIALALLRREAEPGSLLAAGEDGVTAEVVRLPFAASGS